jgi:hypothetical protein
MQHAHGMGSNHAEDVISEADARRTMAAPVKELAHASGKKAYQSHVFVPAHCSHICAISIVLM